MSNERDGFTAKDAKCAKKAKMCSASFLAGRQSLIRTAPVRKRSDVVRRGCGA